MLENKIYQDFIAARKDQNQPKSAFLGLIRSEIKNQAITLKKDALNDTEIIAVLMKFKKRMEDALIGAQSSGRQDLIDQAKIELTILQEYLPKQISAEETAKLVTDIITSTGATSMKDMGKVMAAVKEKVGATADPKIISDIVKAKLSGI